MQQQHSRVETDRQPGHGAMSEHRAGHQPVFAGLLACLAHLRHVEVFQSDSSLRSMSKAVPAPSGHAPPSPAFVPPFPPLLPLLYVSVGLHQVIQVCKHKRPKICAASLCGPFHQPVRELS